MTADTIGGVWTYCVDLIKCLAQDNVHFHLMTSGKRINSSQWIDLKELSNVTVYETDHKLEWMSDPWKDIDDSGRLLMRLEKLIKPDIIHLNSFSYASLPFAAPTLVVAHSDVFSWWNAVKTTKPGSDWSEYFSRVQQGLKNADYIVAPSHAALRDTFNVYGQFAKGKVVYNGRDKMMFSARGKNQQLMCAGRLWDEAKNLQIVLKASRDIKAGIKIAGELPGGIEPNESITFLGRLDATEMASELSTALIYVAPAKYEPFGLSILEAAFCGCVLVLGDIPSLREIWQESAIYINTNDAANLASTCNKLLNDPILTEKYSHRAQERARLFSLQQMKIGYSRLYQQIVQQKHPGKMQTA